MLNNKLLANREAYLVVVEEEIARMEEIIRKKLDAMLEMIEE